MLLDSALQSTADLALERALIRGLFWDADERRRRCHPAAHRRAVTTSGRLLDVTRAAYELGGTEVLRPLLERRLRGRRDPVWSVLETYASRSASILRIPGFYEFDIVGAIAFRELHYGATPDGGPLDPALTYAPIADRFPAFAGEPFDLPALTPGFRWPMVLLVGDRDLRTPPAIAERVAATAERCGTRADRERTQRSGDASAGTAARARPAGRRSAGAASGRVSQDEPDAAPRHRGPLPRPRQGRRAPRTRTATVAAGSDALRVHGFEGRGIRRRHPVDGLAVPYDVVAERLQERLVLPAFELWRRGRGRREPTASPGRRAIRRRCRARGSGRAARSAGA